MKCATLIALATCFAALSFAEGMVNSNATALENCHVHDNVQYCNVVSKGEEIAVATATPGQELPTSYHDCRIHGGGVHCIGSDGGEVFTPYLSSSTQSEEAKEDTSDFGSKEAKEDAFGCSYHAGVLHCPDSSSDSAPPICTQVQHEYNTRKRISSIFFVCATSAVAVFVPLLLRKRLPTSGAVFSGIRQFGTGVVIATAFIHLLTHSQAMFSDPCLGGLTYGAMAAAIAMAGAFAAFFVEYVGGRIISQRRRPTPGPLMLTAFSSPSSQEGPKDAHLHHGLGEEGDTLSLIMLEAGILFHSILIGLTFIMSPDSHFLTMLVVLIFHQSFEGLALGAHLAAAASVSGFTATLLGVAFTAITPIAMAIGLAARNSFDRNDRTTLFVVATSNALSAGVLVWVGCVEMWAGDWVYGHMASAGKLRTTVGMAALCAGMAVMAALGKWA